MRSRGPLPTLLVPLRGRGTDGSERAEGRVGRQGAPVPQDCGGRPAAPRVPQDHRPVVGRETAPPHDHTGRSPALSCVRDPGACEPARDNGPDRSPRIAWIGRRPALRSAPVSPAPRLGRGWLRGRLSCASTATVTPRASFLRPLTHVPEGNAAGTRTA